MLNWEMNFVDGGKKKKLLQKKEEITPSKIKRWKWENERNSKGKLKVTCA